MAELLNVVYETMSGKILPIGKNVNREKVNNFYVTL